MFGLILALFHPIQVIARNIFGAKSIIGPGCNIASGKFIKLGSINSKKNN